MRRMTFVVAVVTVLAAAAALGGCGLARGHVACDMSGVWDPVQTFRSRSGGWALVTATVDERTGTTRVHDPKYRADVHPVRIEAVLVNTADQDVAGIDAIVNVDYSEPSSGCYVPPRAKVSPGSPMAFLLSPPSPGSEHWSIDGSAAAFDLEDSGGRTVAVWQVRPTQGCAGHLVYDLSDLADAFRQPQLTASPPGTCRPAA